MFQSFGTLKANDDFTVLQWNIWQEGTQVAGGFDAIVTELDRLNPDFVTLSEVRNYNGVDFTARLIEELKFLGDTFYTVGSYDSGLLSRFPIERFDTIFLPKGDHGSVYRIHTTSQSGIKFALYSAHLDYQNCAYYETRGYSGVDWKECERCNDVEELLEKNDKSLRDDAILTFLEMAEDDINRGRTVIIGGDFNEPSLLDWTEQTAQLNDHNGLVVPWTVSKLLLENGFIDAFREYFPDPLNYPGFTFPSANPDVKTTRLTWAPKSDERERIDFIYMKSPVEGELSVSDAYIFGPANSICKSLTVKDRGRDQFIRPLGVWPTDHKSLLIKFSVFPVL